MLCTVCHRPVVLVPSAQERAKKYGKSAEYYTKLFPQHSSCTLEKRKRETAELILRLKIEKISGQRLELHDARHS